MSFINTVYAHGGDADETSDNHITGMMSNFGGGAMAFGSIFMILFWVLVIFVVFALIKYVVGNKKNSSKISGIEAKKNKIYTCVECGYEYAEKEWAIKCQNWCREKKSCNLEIIKHGKPGSV